LNLEYFLVGIFLVFTLASNVFWAWVTYNLLNRLMSRTYFEYAQGKREETKKPQPPQSLQEVMIDPEDQRQANEINAIFNIT